MVRLSVIIPTCDREYDLGRCLEALDECRAETRGGEVSLCEVVIVDDCSRDAAATSAVSRTDLPTRVLRNDRRRGAGDSRSWGADVAEGDVLAFLDDDALPRGDWLLIAARALDAPSGITGRVLRFDRGLVSRARQARYDQRYAALSAGTPVSFFAGGNSAIRADVFRAAGGFSRSGTGGDNSIAETLRGRGDPIRFEPDLVIAHRNGKGMAAAASEAWRAGRTHPDRLGPLDAARAAARSGVGPGRLERTVNRYLGTVHALARTARGRSTTTQESATPMSTASITPSPRAETAPASEDGDPSCPRPTPSRTAPAVGIELGVIGLGYAGLPQATAFATADLVVRGFDTDAAVVSMIRQGRSPVDTVTDQTIGRVSDRLSATGDIADLADCSVFVICVPTPTGWTGAPDLEPLRSACRSVAGVLRPGHLVVVESTVHPGATDTVVRTLLEASGLRAGLDFNLAFAPERIDPGNGDYGPTNTPRVIGGHSDVCGRRAAELYSLVVPSVHLTSGLREAEASKMLENTYRQVNLALVHEFTGYCDALGIDVRAVIDAAATKPFGFQPFYPSVGVGGHCIPVDPLYLIASAREQGIPMPLVQTAQDVNDRRPADVAELCRATCADLGLDPRGARVLVLGATYKPNVADVRNSPTVPLIRALCGMGFEVALHDPLVGGLEVDGRFHRVVHDLPGAVERCDVAVLAQRHRHYAEEVLAGARHVLGMTTPSRS